VVAYRAFLGSKWATLASSLRLHFFDVTGAAVSRAMSGGYIR
jgi:hypothetical protein